MSGAPLVTAPARPLYYRPRQVCALLSISKSAIFAAIAAGRLEAVKLDGKVLIPAAALDTYIASAVPVVPTSSGPKTRTPRGRLAGTPQGVASMEKTRADHT